MSIYEFYMQPITNIPANRDEIFTWKKSQTKENCKVRDLKINKSEHITSLKIKSLYGFTRDASGASSLIVNLA